MKRREQGQAIMELVVGLIGILAVILGLLFVAGMGINSLRIYKNARLNAELAMHQSATEEESTSEEGVGDGYDIATWSSPVRDVGIATRIPYDPKATASATGGSLDGTGYSAASFSASDEYEYTFTPLSGIGLVPLADRARFLRTQQVGNSARIAAKLISRAGNFDGHAVLLIDPNAVGGSGGIAETEALENFFFRLTGVRVKSRDLVNQPTNRVYLPALGL